MIVQTRGGVALSSQPVGVSELLSEAFERELDEATDSRVRSDNSVQLLPSGAESFEHRWRMIEEAQHHIHIVAFSMMGDDTTKQLFDRLKLKLKAGVVVRIIVDDAVVYTTRMAPKLQELQSEGAEVIRYHRIFRDLLPDLGRGHPFSQIARIIKLKIKRRFHEKYMVVDGRQAILGGINWGDKYAYGGLRPKAWRDSDVLLGGPIVADIQRQFVRDECLYRAMDQSYQERGTSGLDDPELFLAARNRAAEFERTQSADYFPEPTSQGPARLRYVPHKPYDEGKLRLSDAHLLLIRKARRYIYWGCHGIRPPRVLAETLAQAVKRGVEVRLITNSKRASRTLMFFGLLGWMYQESRKHFPWLLDHGIRVFEWQKPGAFHSKNLAIDDEVASIGSYNVARGSTFHHTESNVIAFGGSLPVQVREQFEIDFADCKEVSLKDFPKLPRDPMQRIIHVRNKLIRPALLPESVHADLEAGRFKTM